MSTPILWYCNWEQTVAFLQRRYLVGGKKNEYTMQSEDITTQELRQWATKYRR
jgi:hypothetical protein